MSNLFRCGGKSGYTVDEFTVYGANIFNYYSRGQIKLPTLSLQKVSLTAQLISANVGDGSLAVVGIRNGVSTTLQTIALSLTTTDYTFDISTYDNVILLIYPIWSRNASSRATISNIKFYS